MFVGLVTFFGGSLGSAGMDGFSGDWGVWIGNIHGANGNSLGGRENETGLSAQNGSLESLDTFDISHDFVDVCASTNTAVGLTQS